MQAQTGDVAAGVLLVMALMASVGSAQEGGAVVRAPLSLAVLAGVEMQGGVLRLPRVYEQEAPGAALWMEAEEYTQARYRPVLGTDPEASGGRYAARIVRADYRFTLRSGGTYQVWQRALFPFAAHWSHTEAMNSLVFKGLNVRDCTPEETHKVGTYTWIRAGRYELPPGEHIFSLNYHGGAQLDKILLTPDLEFVPEGLGEPARAGGSARGVAVGADLQPASVLGWERLHWRADPKGGNIRVEWSADGGAIWQPLPEDLSLAEIPARGEGQDRLRLRFTLETGPQGESPTVQDPVVTYRSGLELPRPRPLPRGLRDDSGRLPLIFSRAPGCEWTATEARLAEPPATPDAAGLVWLEAEAAEGMRLGPDTLPAVVSAEGASGGQALQFGPRGSFGLRYRFCLPEEQETTVWLRARLADREYLRHFQSFNGGQLQAVPPAPSAGADWQWYRGITQKLPAGFHVLHLESESWPPRGLDFSRLDQIALSPSREEPPAGEPGTPRVTPPAEGSAEVFAVQAPPGARYQRLTARGGGWRAEVSLDGGETWRATPDGDLSWIPAEQSEPLHVRFLLRGPQARVAEAVIAYTGAAEPFARLAARNWELYLLPGEAAVVGMYDRSLRRWVMPLGSRQSFLEFDWHVPGTTWVNAFTGAQGLLVSQEPLGGAGLRLGYSFQDDAFRVTCTLDLGSGELSTWDVHVENRSSVEVRRVQFPALGPLRLSEGGEGDTLMWPFPYGAQLRNPARLRPWKLIHPGSAAMGWTDLYDDQGGVYLSLANTDLLATDLDFAPDPDSGSVRLRMARQVCVPPGESWEGSYRVAVHPGGWHWGADRYRAWLETWMQPPQHPQWLQDTPGIGDLALTTDMWPARFDHAALRARLLGSNYIQHWGMTGEAESCGFLPYLNPRLGSPEDYARGHEVSRRLGVHHTYYMNCQGWVPEFAELDRFGFIPRRFFPEDFELPSLDFYLENAVYPLSGELEPGGPGLNWTTDDRIMCAASAGWREHLRHWMVDQYAEVFRTSGTYLDQTAVVGPRQCWKPDHGHGRQHGYWGRGLTELLETTVTEARRTNPDYIVGVEGASDAMNQWSAYGLWSGDPAVWLYTVPGAIPMVNCLHFPTRVLAHYQEFLRRNWLNGRLWAGRYEDWFYDRNKWEHGRLMNNTLRECFALKNATMEWEREARYRDTVGLTVSHPRVEARWWALGGGAEGALINVHNEDRHADVLVTLAEPRWRAARAVAYTPEGLQEIRLTATREGVSFTAPEAPIASVVLVTRPGSEQPVSLLAEQPWESGPPDLVATLVNWTGREISGRVTVRVPEGSGLNFPAQEITLPPGRPVRVGWEAPEIAALPRPEEVQVVFTFSADRRPALAREVLLFPVLWNPGFEEDRTGDDHPDGWGIFDWGLYHVFIRHVHDVPLEGLFGTRDRGAAVGEWCLRLDPPVQYSYEMLVGDPEKPHFHDRVTDGTWVRRAMQDARLRPGTTYRFSARIRREVAEGETWAEVAGWRLQPAAEDTPGEWHSYETTFTTGPAEGGLHLVRLHHNAPRPAWFDEVRIEELR